jgi:zinc transport system substrate-binding protein
MVRFDFIKNTVLFLVLFLAGCKGTGSENNVLSVSVLPQKFFVDELTGGALDVNVMIPPGASHSTYSPTPQQFKKLSDSRLYLGIGHLGYEQAWMPRLSELNSDMQVVILSDKVATIAGSCDDHHHHHDHNHQGVDPHIWMSPKVMLELMPHIKSALLLSYPELASAIESNYDNLYQRIENVDNVMSEVTSSLGNRKFIIFHPALTYLARDYDLEQVSIEHDGKEPSPAFLAQVIQRAKSEKITVIFIQQEYDVRNAEVVSKEANLQLIQINPMAYSWIESMEHLIEIFKTHLHE